MIGRTLSRRIWRSRFGHRALDTSVLDAPLATATVIAPRHEVGVLTRSGRARANLCHPTWSGASVREYCAEPTAWLREARAI